MPDDMRELERRIGYAFGDPALLVRALTRLAFSKEQNLAAEAHMDALATLGDAVIDVIVIESLVTSGMHDKGEITNRKTNLVNMTQLRRLAEGLELEGFVRWGKGEHEQHVWTSGRVLAECIEALIGAVYLDGGLNPRARCSGGLNSYPEFFFFNVSSAGDGGSAPQTPRVTMDWLRSSFNDLTCFKRANRERGSGGAPPWNGLNSDESLIFTMKPKQITVFQISSWRSPQRRSPQKERRPWTSSIKGFRNAL